ncbi:hypothetical protein GCM10007160_12340 [Litchfieldella qijiaojingensis]|uniref:Carboxypeptidase regulatory-like domain-containing protein n=1 Tax=Litchfieldella qijiaojingensis TaxID=980347 RepID=A0ABQ2YJM9_9GAMM|nr:hypothetical protein [Halomonas qijiaojingensis]GGX86541.1 hypothetical protein GCM10007160_12340 [Halomonas qijiaojingensis]
MNRSNLVISLSVALMLGLGGVDYALAMSTPELPHNGASSLRLVPTSYVDRYLLNVDSPTRIRISSESWGSIGVNMIIKACLLDQDNNVVSTARQRDGNFVIDETLRPGRYILEVEGQEMSDRIQTNNRYSVRTIIF